ncbi:capsule biosynthesis GfcC family protein [Phytohalomonas tamaricis]|uniref:capsule biosynthesis GfcC family protein n=1 Tax=Phytohalomonas tamaricis TaxID=2081032 RepID=UPI001319E473|nr:capsule biosynthesis GfcC family protein [Phytohalomonas tamaricis]
MAWSPYIHMEGSQTMVIKRTVILMMGIVLLGFLPLAHAYTLHEAVVNAFAEKEDVFWPAAFYHNAETDNEHISAERLAAELDNLALQFRINGEIQSRSAILQWQKTVLSLQGRRRTVARIDPVMLLAHPRQNVTINNPVVFGMCSPSDFIEIWSSKGVVRRPWHSGITTNDIKQELPHSQGISSQWVNLITPDGHIQRLGIAAWNNTSKPLPPGARVVSEISLNIVAAHWFNQALPQWLATRWPGDHCQSWIYSPNMTPSNEN